ncbi:hypothetical protein CPB84DRAFT_1331858 [Gymnopilus junonius]|uniref:Uncharacterized protein n=1 Tax=Gymnopilus junonius TaxID=109634 RepID=A0A9P5NKF0_GYMJU|nr:hypothetical protein CPB84DRAFT_1331858 [Gymnopilus junonius]
MYINPMQILFESQPPIPHGRSQHSTPRKRGRILRAVPEGRLCRFVNRRSGTLLDVRSLDLVNDAVPQVVGNAEKDGVQYWIITPLGDGQAIIPVPRDGSGRVLYLTPSTIDQGRPITVSPFPTSWQILPSSECPTGNPLTGFSVPQGLYEEWTCLICYPHFRNGDPRMLDLWAGESTPNNRVVVYPFLGRSGNSGVFSLYGTRIIPTTPITSMKVRH